jgi:hypothetical protein
MPKSANKISSETALQNIQVGVIKVTIYMTNNTENYQNKTCNIPIKLISL